MWTYYVQFSYLRPQVGAITSISDLVESLQRRGRYAFTRIEVAAALPLSEGALTKGLQRLAHKGRVRMLRRGFYVIIPVEYSATGMIPTDWFIAELMQFLDQPYYIGVLSAAALHGAAHQQPQEYHVVVPKPERPVRQPSVTIRFFRHAAMSATPTESVKGYTGMLPVSTPAATALDLVRFAAHIGGLDAVLTVLAELAEKLTPENVLAAAQTESELAQVQRLGWLLDRVGHPKLAEPVANWLADRIPNKVRLDPRRPALGARKDARWQVVVNAEPQSEI
jgi:predicted transcriptional regulator of viral defense system